MDLDKTLELLKKYREQNDESALLELMKSNDRLINYFVRGLLGKGVPYEDLYQTGRLELLRAIQRFDYENNPMQAFSTYISSYIKGGMLKELKKNRKHSHVLSFDQTIGQNKDGDDLKLEDLIGTDADELINNVIDAMKIDAVKESLSCLTTREKQIILLRYGLDELHRKTQEELAVMFKTTQASICREEKKAILKMRHPRNTKKIKDFID